MERDLKLHSNFPCMNFNFFFIKVTLSALKKKIIDVKNKEFTDLASSGCESTEIKLFHVRACSVYESVKVQVVALFI